MKKFLAQSYIYLLLVMLYAPLVIIVVFSFTEARALGNWTGFSTQLYESLFTGGMRNSEALSAALKNTLIIATVSALVARIVGTVSAIGIHSLRGRKRKAITFFNNIPMLNPDIITGVSLFLLFVSLGFPSYIADRLFRLLWLLKSADSAVVQGFIREILPERKEVWRFLEKPRARP